MKDHAKLFRLCLAALLSGALGMALMLGAWRLYSDYRDFEIMRAFLIPIMQQQAQQQRQQAAQPKPPDPPASK